MWGSSGCSHCCFPLMEKWCLAGACCAHSLPSAFLSLVPKLNFKVGCRAGRKKWMDAAVDVWQAFKNQCSQNLEDSYIFGDFANPLLFSERTAGLCWTSWTSGSYLSNCPALSGGEKLFQKGKLANHFTWGYNAIWTVTWNRELGLLAKYSCLERPSGVLTSCLLLYWLIDTQNWLTAHDIFL